MSETGVLGKIVERARAGVAQRKELLPLEVIQAVADEAPPRRSFLDALKTSGRVNVIAEYKRRSPSRGVIREDLSPQDVATAYETAGAAALSVLTDEEFFGGQLDHLTAVRGATKLPAIRKDFVVDAYQVWEARAASADAILLIVAALRDAELQMLLREAKETSLDVLVEVHDGAELDRALGAGASIIGVNNRNLKTMEVRLETSLELLPRIPAPLVKVAESGIKTGADIRKLRTAGFDAFLVGEHLMQSPEPGAALKALLAEASA
jgi:indole-3-glycerol phosphate synthase